MKKITLAVLIILVGISWAQPKKKVQWNDLQEAVKDSIRESSGNVDVILNALGDTIAVYLTAFANDSLTASNGIVYSGRDFSQKIVKNIATLQAYQPDSVGTTVYLCEVATGGYGGGVVVYVDSTDFRARYGTAIPDSIIVFHAPGSDRIWVRKDWDGFTLKAEWSGAVHNNSTDDTDELQKIITLFNTYDAGELVLPSGVYVISDTLHLPNRAFTIRGTMPTQRTYDSTQVTVIRQTNANAPAFYIAGSNVDLIRWIRIEDLTLDGPGEGTSTTAGIVLGTPTSSYSGDFAYINQIMVKDFQTGILIDGVAQFTIQNSSILENEKYGIKCNGTSFFNSGTIRDCNVALSDTLFWNEGGTGSRGMVIEGGDWNIANRFVHMKGAGQLTLIGGNWEASTGTDFIYLNNSMIMTIIGKNFRYVAGVGGLNVPLVRLGSTCDLYYNGNTEDLDTIDVVIESATSDVYATMPVRCLFGSDTFFVSGFDYNATSTLQSASLANRGKTFFTIHPSDQDRIQTHYKGRGGTAQIAELIQPDFQFSLTGTSHVFLSAMDNVIGGKTFTTASNALDTTQIVINIGTFTTPNGSFSFTAGVGPNGNLDSTWTVICGTRTPATGSITFVVRHIGISGTTNNFLFYNIWVRRDD